MRSFILITLAVLCLSSGVTRAHADSEFLITSEENGIGDLQKLVTHFKKRLVSVKPIFDRNERRVLRKIGKLWMGQFQKVTVSDPKLISEINQWKQKKKLAVSIEENQPVQLAADSNSDPLSTLQWGMSNRGDSQSLEFADFTTMDIPGKAGEDIGLDRISSSSLSKPVLVAILDTGIDAKHPDLKEHIFRNQTECDALEKFKACLKDKPKVKCLEEFKGGDTDGNEYPFDCTGWNLVPVRNLIDGVRGDPDTSDTEGHGTHVAGVIGAVSGNKIGIRGVAQNALLLPVKVVASSPNSPVRPQGLKSVGTSVPPGSHLPGANDVENKLKWNTTFVDIIARGMLYALHAKAQVINLSMAWPFLADSPTMRQMADAAAQMGTIIVSSAGNDSARVTVMPCKYRNVICVGAHGPDGAFSHFSNYGSAVDILAPGFSILSTWPMKLRPDSYTDDYGYEYLDGTSMAAPFVTGAVAALLGAGYSPQETYARLIVGARPTRFTLLRGPLYGEKYSRSGNMDLAASLKATPEPLILPAIKEQIHAEWDRQSASIPFEIPLKNYWSNAHEVHISAKMIAETGPTYAHLNETEWTVSEWAESRIQKLSSHIEVEDPLVSGDLILELTVQAQGFSERKFRMELEIDSPVRPDGSDPEQKVIPLADGKVSESADVRTIKTFYPVTDPDYLTFEMKEKEWILQLLRSDGKSYRVTATRSIEPIIADVINNNKKKEKKAANIQIAAKLDVNRDGKEDYVILFKIPEPDPKTSAPYRFQFFDENLQPLKMTIGKSQVDCYDYDNDLSQIPDKFRWLTIHEKGEAGESDRMVPAWIGLGPQPKVERAPYTPWDPDPDYPLGVRFYYLASDGLRSITAPGNSFFVEMLTPTDEDKKQGVIKVLMATGDDYILNYTIGTVRGTEITDIQPFALKDYRRLYGISDILPVLSLDGENDVYGTAFAGPSIAGNQRTTLVPHLVSQKFENIDRKQAPASVTDSVVWVSGAYWGKVTHAVFAETHYELQYYDLDNDQTALTTLNRYSFLPDLLSFNNGRFPTIVKSGKAGKGDLYLPAMLVTEDVSPSGRMEVVVPSYDEKGKLLGLNRPARFHLDEKDCLNLAPMEADQATPAQAAFFCGDRFVRVPLQY